MNEMKSLTLNGTRYDSFPDQCAVRYVAQESSPDQQAQARVNIGVPGVTNSARFTVDGGGYTIEVDLNYPIYDGASIVFRSPVDCSEVTGLTVYYPANGETASKEFAFVDAHGEDVGLIKSPSAFGEGAVVTVVLDGVGIDAIGKAFVQNADTNAYLEKNIRRLDEIDSTSIIRKTSGSVVKISDSSDRKLKGLTIFGKTSYDESARQLMGVGEMDGFDIFLSGKNLYEPLSRQQSVNGLTVRQLNSNTVSVTGAVASDSQVSINLMNSAEGVRLARGQSYALLVKKEGSDAYMNEFTELLVDGEPWVNMTSVGRTIHKITITRDLPAGDTSLCGKYTVLICPRYFRDEFSAEVTKENQKVHIPPLYNKALHGVEITDREIYNFYSEEYEDGNIGSYTSLIKSRYDSNETNIRFEAAQSAYQFRQIGYTDNNGNIVTTDGANKFASYYHSMQYCCATDGWIAFRIKAPGTGTYNVSLFHGSCENGALNINAYMLESSSYESILGENATAYSEAMSENPYQTNGTTDAFIACKSAIESCISNSTVVATMNCYNPLYVQGISESFEYDFEGDKEYILVLKATVKSPDHKSNAYILFDYLTAEKLKDSYKMYKSEWAGIKIASKIQEIKDAYDSKLLNWRYEFASSPYQLNRTSAFDEGTESFLHLTGRGTWLALRFRSPGKGNYDLTIRHGARTSGANLADIYVVKASEIDDVLGANAEIYAEAIANDPFQDDASRPSRKTELFDTYAAAVENTLDDESLVANTCFYSVSNKTKGLSIDLSYNFEKDTEYVIILKAVEPCPGGSNAALLIDSIEAVHKKSPDDVVIVPTHIDEYGHKWVCDTLEIPASRVVRRIGLILDYDGRDVGDYWISSTGELSQGAEVCYLLSDDSYEYIPITIDENISNLHTYANNTLIWNNAGVEQEVVYVADPKAYIDLKLEEELLPTNSVVDTIIAKGTSGIWTWEKWASGKAVCWANPIFKDVDASGPHAADGLYGGAVPAQSFPFPFTATPLVFTSVYSTICEYVTVGPSTIGATGTIYPTFNNNEEPVSLPLNIYVIGKWK